MRIAHFVQGRCNPDSANGVDKTVFHVGSAQARRGHEVLVLSQTDKPALPIEKVRSVAAPPRIPGRLSPQLVSHLRQFAPELIHLHSAYVPPNIHLAALARRHGVPYVVTPNGNLSAALMNRRPLIKKAYRRLFELPCLNRAAFVHSVGDTEQIRAYGVTRPTVEAPNGFDPADLPENLDEQALRRQLPEAQEAKVLLFLGRMDVEQKGLDMLLKAMRQVTAGGQRLHLVLVGPDWHGGTDRLRRQAAQLEVEHCVHFWDPAFGRAKYELLVGCDAFIHPSRWEGLSLAVVEAMACGKLCVVSQRADPLHLLESAEAGIVFKPSEEQLVGALERVLAMAPEQARQCGQRARQLVVDRLNWDRTAEVLDEAFARHGLLR